MEADTEAWSSASNLIISFRAINWNQKNGLPELT